MAPRAADQEGVLPDATILGSDEATEISRRAFAADPTIIPALPQPTGGGTWEGAWHIGDGGFGRCSLFISFDPTTDLVQDRIAVKESICDARDWYDPLYWTGKYDGEGCRDYSAAINHSEHIESFLLRRITAQQPSTIVRYRGRSAVNVERWDHRLYMAFCELESLDSLIELYRSPCWTNTPNITYIDEDGDEIEIPKKIIPEPFVWYVFDSLALAAIMMERGTETAGQPVPGWNQIVHRDIKPKNIFLASPQTGARAEFQLYPTIHLGDLGIAVETNVSDPPQNNPRSYRGIGTSGFKPPEFQQWIRRASRFHFDWPALDSWSNVYQIGLVIYCLIYHTHDPNFTDKHLVRGPTPKDYPRPPHNPTGPIPGPGYSPSLISLMEDCLKFNPALRPSLDEIRARITPHWSLNPDRNHFKGMRRVVPTPGVHWADDPKAGRYRLMRDFRRYAIGLARDALPERIGE